MPDAHNQDVISSAMIQNSRVEVEVSTILRDVMDSWNSKTIEQQLCDSGAQNGWCSRV